MKFNSYKPSYISFETTLVSLKTILSSSSYAHCKLSDSYKDLWDIATNFVGA